MRQMGCAYRKAWLSDAQKIYFMFTRSSAGCCLRNAVIGETTRRSLMLRNALRLVFSRRRAFRSTRFIDARRLHSFRKSRRYAANWVRLPKGVAFGRAENLFYVHAFLGRLLPAERRDRKTTPRGAVRLAAGFSSVPRDWGHAFYKCAAHSPFPVQLPAVR